MKKKNFILFIIIILLITFVSGCTGSSGGDGLFGPNCPTCPSPGGWSECSEEAMRTRTNYKCGEETNYECQSYTEEKACEIEIKLKNKDLEAIISPTLDETVKDIIKVEVVKVPEETNLMLVFLIPQGVDLGSEMTAEESEQSIQIADSSGSDGWKVFLDTTKVDNGLYTIIIGTQPEDPPEENPLIGTQLIVEN
jgi:hypothetical protein